MLRRLLQAGTVAWLALVLAVAPGDAQNIDDFERSLRDADPSGEVVLGVQQVESSTLAYVYVSDVWYMLPCYKRRRLAKNLRTIWRGHGGSNIVVYDKARTEVAGFETFGSGFDVRGCD